MVCSLCRADRKCQFHRAANAEELMVAVVEALRSRALLGLSLVVEASLATLADSLPQGVRSALPHMDDRAVLDRVHAILAKKEWTAKDLRKLAAHSLALAIATEEEDDDGSTTTGATNSNDRSSPGRDE